MIAAPRPRRSGITLTEILIAILIMGVGLISLATLFPLGLVRLREGTRQGRAGTTFETAADDMDARALLFKPTFTRTWYGARDPFVQDILANGSYNQTNTAGQGVLASGNFELPNNNVNLTTGLPFCYDPLWRAITGVAPLVPAGYTSTAFPKSVVYDKTFDVEPGSFTASDEARFGSGIFAGATPYIQPDPNNDTTDYASAHGLQRLTNFVPWSNLGNTSTYAFTYTNPSSNFAGVAQPPDVAGNVFTSVDDILFNPVGGAANAPSPVLPDMTAGVPQADYRFTWFFTGRQVDANGNGTQFDGEVVVCDGRPFGFDPLPGGGSAPTGETVVEAIYGYGGNPKAILLRWSNTLADPQIRVGGWICDTTYERSVPVYVKRALNTLSVYSPTPFARCYWYQVAKRSDPTPDLTVAGYRSAIVTLSNPVRIKTATAGGLGLVPIHLNVALIMPSVVNVFPRTFEVH